MIWQWIDEERDEIGFIWMKSCMYGYQLLINIRIKCDERLWNSKHETMHCGVSFICNFICVFVDVALLDQPNNKMKLPLDWPYHSHWMLQQCSVHLATGPAAASQIFLKHCTLHSRCSKATRRPFLDLKKF